MEDTYSLDMELEIALIKQDLAEITSEHEELIDDVQTADDDIAQLERRIEQLKADTLEFMAETDEYKVEFSQFFSQIPIHYTIYETFEHMGLDIAQEFAEITSEHEELIADVQRADHDIAQLKQRIAQMEQDIAQLKVDTLNFMAENDEYKVEFSQKFSLLEEKLKEQKEINNNHKCLLNAIVKMKVPEIEPSMEVIQAQAVEIATLRERLSEQSLQCIPSQDQRSAVTSAPGLHCADSTLLCDSSSNVSQERADCLDGYYTYKDGMAQASHISNPSSTNETNLDEDCSAEVQENMDWE